MIGRRVLRVQSGARGVVAGWATRTAPQVHGVSASDAVGRRPAQACHPVQDVAREERLTPSSVCRPRSESWSVSGAGQKRPRTSVVPSTLPTLTSRWRPLLMRSIVSRRYEEAFCPASIILPGRRQLESRVNNPQSPSVSTQKSPSRGGALAETPTFTEIVINSGSTAELARVATTIPTIGGFRAPPITEPRPRATARARRCCMVRPRNRSDVDVADDHAVTAKDCAFPSANILFSRVHPTLASRCCASNPIARRLPPRIRLYRRNVPSTRACCR